VFFRVRFGRDRASLPRSTTSSATDDFERALPRVARRSGLLRATLVGPIAVISIFSCNRNRPI